MRKLTILVVLVALAAIAAQGKMRNLTGTWKVNVEKSTFGGPPPQSSVYKVKDAADGFFITMIETRDGQEMIIESRFDRHGKETVNHAGGMEIRTVMKEDGDVIREQSVFTSNSGSMTRKSTLSLSGDGKLMTLDSAFTSDRGDFKVKLVLEKQ